MLMRQSLRRSNILRGYRSFSTVISHGALLVERPVRFYYILEESSDPRLRIGFAVARGVKGAVHRNRIKRVLREAVRLHRQTLDADLRLQRRTLRAVALFTPSGPSSSPPNRVNLATVEAAIAQLLTRIDHQLANPKS